jgi:hypothetical protein
MRKTLLASDITLNYEIAKFVIASLVYPEPVEGNYDKFSAFATLRQAQGTVMLRFVIQRTLYSVVYFQRNIEIRMR